MNYSSDYLAHKLKVCNYLVTQERDTLEVTVVGLQSQIKVGLLNIDELRQTMNTDVLCKIKQACRSKLRLQQIALKPNHLTEVEYIDLLIETEKREAKPRWLDCVKALVMRVFDSKL